MGLSTAMAMAADDEDDELLSSDDDETESGRNVSNGTPSTRIVVSPCSFEHFRFDAEKQTGEKR